jgi:hypothetical protein
MDGGSDAGVDAGAECLTEDPCPVTSGGDLFVDSVGGLDGPCCCGSQARPCRSLTQATMMIGAVRAENVTVHAFNSDRSPLWAAPEAWPVLLYLGVQLEAPDIDFLSLDGGVEDGFCAVAWDDADDLEVAITGAETPDGGLLCIQIPLDGGGYGPAERLIGNAIEVGRCDTYVGVGTVPLRVSNVWLNGGYMGMDVGPDAFVTLGPNPVWIGNRGVYAGGNTSEVGVYCSGSVGEPAVVRDTGSDVVHIDSSVTDLWTGEYCSISLTHGPVLGLPPTGGLDGCPGQVDVIGVGVGFETDVLLGSTEEPATIQCQGDDGIDIIPDVDSTVSFQGTIRNCDCYASQIQGGTLTLVNSQISYNYGGIWVGDGGTVNLAVNRYAVVRPGPSDLACSAELERAGELGGYSIVDVNTIGPYGAGLINTSASATIDAENVLWKDWDPDAGMPQVWSCVDPTFLVGCTCHGPGCVPDAGLPANPSALYIEGNPHPFDFADGGLASTNCGETCSTDDAGLITCVLN